MSGYVWAPWWVWFTVGAVLPPVAVLLWLPLRARFWLRRGRVYNLPLFTRDWVELGLVHTAAWWCLIHSTAGVCGGAGAAASAAIAAVIIWIRRKPRRSLQLLGAKSKAARDALVDAMRREQVPSEN